MRGLPRLVQSFPKEGSTLTQKMKSPGFIGTHISFFEVCVADFKFTKGGGSVLIVTLRLQDIRLISIIGSLQLDVK